MGAVSDVDPTERKHAAVVLGAGLAGSLLACTFAQRGYFVDVYEKRGDFRESGKGLLQRE